MSLLIFVAANVVPEGRFPCKVPRDVEGRKRGWLIPNIHVEIVTANASRGIMVSGLHFNQVCIEI